MSSNKHLLQYLFLFIGLIAVSVPFIWLAHNHTTQTIAAGVSSLLFITWGLVHHINEGRLRKSVVGEYLLLGVVIFFIIFTLLSLF